FMLKSLLKNENAVSPVLGAVLMLAVAVTLLTALQLNFVPVWNTQEELDHLKEMLDDFKDLKSGIESSIQSGTTLSLPLTMGFKYSPKMFVYNPRESAYTSLDIQENTWAEVRYNEMFPEGMTDDTSIKNVTTSTITYALKGVQNYNSFIYEHGMIRRGNSNYTTSSQTALANGTIYLLSVKPRDSESTSSVEKRTVNIYPTSQQKNSVIGKNVWLILHTKPIYVNWWKESIEKEGGNVKKVDINTGTVIAYVPTMVIKMGEAYISTASKAAPAHALPSRIIKITPGNTYLSVDGIANLVAEVQDKYNNPVPNVQVNFKMNTSRGPSNACPADDCLIQRTATSGADGRASVSLKTSGAGFYYIDASLTSPAIQATFVYPATSQGEFLSLQYNDSDPEFPISATLKSGLGNPISGQNITFATSDGNLSTFSDSTDVSGNATTTLNVTTATGMKITQIENMPGLSTSTRNITWETLNEITVTAKSGYVFSSIVVPTRVITTGCVQYGTNSQNYSNIKCDSNGSSHNILLNNLTPDMVYYFIVNSSHGGANVNSTEYMFATGTPPASVKNLTNVTYEPLYIKWTWEDPDDSDFEKVKVYIDDVYQGEVLKGIQSYNASYLKPNRTYSISVYTVDVEGYTNDTLASHYATTPSVYTYVFSFLNTTGQVTGFSNAQNATDGTSATFSEELDGGINASNRTSSPEKNITTGAQSGTYDPGNLNSADLSLDITTNGKQIKTVVYYMGQRENSTDLAANTDFTGSPVDVNLPEQGVVVRTAWLELQQLSGTTAAANVSTIDMYLNGVNYSVIKGGTYQTNSAESVVTIARADVTSAFSTFVNPTSYAAAVRTGGAASNAQAILLYITYEYDPDSPVQLKTIRYPLGTNTALRAIGSTTTFNYNVSIPEAAATIRSSWFEIRGLINNPGSSSIDATIAAKIQPNATFSTGVSLDMANRDMFGFLYLFKTTSQFSPNSQQTLNVTNLGQIVYALGGEVVVTYEYPISASVHLKTVKYYVGQQTVRGGTGTFSDFTTVFMPEQSVNIKSVYARTRATYSTGTAGTQTIVGRIGGTGTASQAYAVDMNSELIGNYFIIYNMSSAASSLMNNTVVFVNNTFSNTNHGPPGTELYITYEYDPSSPIELKTVEYPAGQSAVQFATRNEAFEIFVPEKTTTRRSAYIDYAAMSSATAIFTISSAIDTVFSSQTVNMDNTAEALTAGALNGDSGSRITAASNVYDINYSSSATASFSGVARLTYEYVKNSINVTYTFTESNSSARWQDIRINDSSYGDALANVSIFNNASGQWESILLASSPFTGGALPAEHVNITLGASENASDYNTSGQIMIRYNWTGGTYNNSLGVDLINVTVHYIKGGSYRLNVTSNTTEVPENNSAQELQIKYNSSGDNFTLQLWNSSSLTWNNRTTLNQPSPSYENITLLPEELIQYDNFTGVPFSIKKYFVPVRYLGENPDVKGRLYLDYQRVNTK
ncbi:MAG TPA: Ig-like domain-containing protein, partial [candidate division Zixibacteria bacterium]|nr:Ig-like domain-containing protein [candidate division Zixibacteria bacterium]